jgi:hypothetical protein
MKFWENISPWVRRYRIAREAFRHINTGRKRWKAKRKAKRSGRIKEKVMPEVKEPVLRTSTKGFMGGVPLAVGAYVQGVKLIPGEGALEQFLLLPETVAFVGVLLTALVARFVKTAHNPGML